jgi:hypothetical protein
VSTDGWKTLVEATEYVITATLMERCLKFPYEGLGFQAVCCERVVCKM